jgi:hypothetical protein
MRLYEIYDLNDLRDDAKPLFHIAQTFGRESCMLPQRREKSGYLKTVDLNLLGDRRFAFSILLPARPPSLIPEYPS